LWNDIFNFSQDYVGIPRGTVRATVLIETILAAFEMDEIMYELREHSSGLNCGRWDYIFSFIKKFNKRPDFILPNRAEVTMTQPFLASYVALLIQQCHRRNAHAMGGMAAQIPIKNDPVANENAMAKVREDKVREVKAGHDGTWVAHPGLVSVAKDIFDEYMKGPNQIDVKRSDVHVTAKDLLAIPKGTITAHGLRWNIDVGLQYLASWLAGNGCVPIYNLMEDAATAEISRTQVWQWVKHGAKLDTGETVTAQMARDNMASVLDGMKAKMGEENFNASKFPAAGKILVQLMTSPEFHEFLTLDAYAVLA
jgi:malate synthase